MPVGKTVIRKSVVRCVQKDYCQFLIKFNNENNFKMYKNITTIYKHIYNLIQTNLLESKLLKYICTDTKLLKKPSSLKLGLN